MTTTKLGLTETANGQANYLNVNTALSRLDQLVFARVVDRNLSAPPGSPANGAMYIPAATATGAWAGKENNLAWWLTDANQWFFLAPAEGMGLIWVLDEDIYVHFNGTAWVEFAGGGGGSANWGDIGGTLSDQTDLQAALDDKLGDAPSDGTGYVRKNGAWAAESGGGGSSDSYTTATVVAGSLTLDYSEANYFGVSLVENVSSLNISGASPGVPAVLNVLFSQDATGGNFVSLPTGGILASGIADVVSSDPLDISLVRLTSVDGGSQWLVERVATFPGSLPFSLPTIADENATFNDEGDSTTGWTATLADMSVTGSALRITKNTAASGNAKIEKTVTLAGTNKDFIIYGKARMSKATSLHGGVIWLSDSGKVFAIWMNYNDAASPGSKNVLGAISITGNNSGSSTAALCASGVDTEIDGIEFALQYDNKFSTMSCFFREADGRWSLKARIAHTWFSVPVISMLTISQAPISAWMEFDYLTVAKPNIAVIGDSIAEGKTLHSPNLSLGLSNYESTWTRHAKLYPSLRNNLPVNKGVGSETSTATLARITDVTDIGARVVFLHASTNDEGAAISQGTRTSNITSMVSAIEAASAECVLLNAMYGTSANANNPDLRDYMLEWWTDSAETVGAFSIIDIASRVNDGGFAEASLMQADNIHPNISGYTLIGNYIGLAS